MVGSTRDVETTAELVRRDSRTHCLRERELRGKEIFIKRESERVRGKEILKRERGGEGGRG